MERIFHNTYHSDKANNIWQIFKFELINIQPKITHISIAIGMTLSLAHILKNMVSFPRNTVIITMSNPKLEVISSIRS